MTGTGRGGEAVCGTLKRGQASGRGDGGHSTGSETGLVRGVCGDPGVDGTPSCSEVFHLVPGEWHTAYASIPCNRHRMRGWTGAGPGSRSPVLKPRMNPGVWLVFVTWDVGRV